MADERLTIPSACVAALGGLSVDDPPVLIAAGSMARPVSWHRLETRSSHPPGRLLVAQSAPALLRVLARYVRPESPPLLCECPVLWYRTDDYGHAAGWCLEWAGDVTLLEGPVLSSGMDPMRALAETLVWLALQHWHTPDWAVEVLDGQR